jgi:hypothetical protein
VSPSGPQRGGITTPRRCSSPSRWWCKTHNLIRSVAADAHDASGTDAFGRDTFRSCFLLSVERVLKIPSLWGERFPIPFISLGQPSGTPTCTNAIHSSPWIVILAEEKPVAVEVFQKPVDSDKVCLFHHDGMDGPPTISVVNVEIRNTFSE